MFHSDVLSVMPLEHATHTVPTARCLATLIAYLFAAVVLRSCLSSTRLPAMQRCLTCIVPSSAYCVFPNRSVMGAFQAEYQQLLTHGFPPNTRAFSHSAVQ